MLKKSLIHALRRLSKNRLYTIRRGLARGLKRRGGLSFLPQLALTKEERFLKTLDLTGMTVFDVGGFEGLFTLFFARAVGPHGRVVTFEPNPANCESIRTNVAVNQFSHVEIRQIALGSHHERGTLVVPRREFGRGTMDGAIKDRILRESGARTITVELDTLNNQVANGVPSPDLVKIDVEGLELEVLRGMDATMATHRPKLYIEIHGADTQRKADNVALVVQFLSERGYSIRHVESDTVVTPANSVVAREGHIFCT